MYWQLKPCHLESLFYWQHITLVHSINVHDIANDAKEKKRKQKYNINLNLPTL